MLYEIEILNAGVRAIDSITHGKISLATTIVKKLFTHLIKQQRRDKKIARLNIICKCVCTRMYRDNKQ